MVHRRTCDFLQKNYMFNENQYGLRAKPCTTSVATSLIIDVVSALENKDSVLRVFLDLSKAFDMIDHQILLHKLDFYGIEIKFKMGSSTQMI